MDNDQIEFSRKFIELMNSTRNGDMTFFNENKDKIINDKRYLRKAINENMVDLVKLLTENGANIIDYDNGKPILMDGLPLSNNIDPAIFKLII